MPRKGGVPENLVNFKEGEDSRRNLKGRPKKLPSLDVLLPEVLGSELDDDSKIKRILQKLTQLAYSKGNVRAAQILLERAYGAPKQTISMDNEITITVKHES